MAPSGTAKPVAAIMSGQRFLFNDSRHKRITSFIEDGSFPFKITEPASAMLLYMPTFCLNTATIPTASPATKMSVNLLFSIQRKVNQIAEMQKSISNCIGALRKGPAGATHTSDKTDAINAIFQLLNDRAQINTMPTVRTLNTNTAVIAVNKLVPKSLNKAELMSSIPGV
jgi:hypothetical protein